MGSRFEYKIIPNKNLVIEHYSGTVYLDDFVSFKIKQSNDKNYSVNFNLLVDLRDSVLMLNEEDISKIFKLISENKIKVLGKIAQLTSTPNQVVVTTLVELHKTVAMNTGIYSTLESSIDFLGYPKSDLEFINDSIEEIKMQ